MIGRLFGLKAAPAAGCRVVELGCGDGVNALAIAQTLPQAQITGVDLSPAAIDRGRSLARAAGLDNVELRVGDLGDPGWRAGLGPVDYVIAHGVYSWIGPAARGALLDACRELLAPDGIAFISYNAYPGSYLRDMARDMLAFHLRGVAGPAARISGAQQLMRAIVSVESPSPYARVLREHLQRMLGASDALLYHDDLASISTPFYFHEFMEHAVAHGLQFLSEADLADSQMRDVAESVAELIDALPPDVVVREQYLDFFANRMFRQTLLVHGELPVRRAIDDRCLETLVVSSPAQRTEDGFVAGAAGLRTTDPVVQAAMEALARCWPAGMPFPELAAGAAAGESAPAARDRLRATLLDAYLARVVFLHSVTFPIGDGRLDRPRASPLARAQCAVGGRVLASLLGTPVAVEQEADRRLLALLDGTRDRAALAAAAGLDAAVVDEALGQLAGLGLLLAP